MKTSPRCSLTSPFATVCSAGDCEPCSLQQTTCPHQSRTASCSSKCHSFHVIDAQRSDNLNYCCCRSHACAAPEPAPHEGGRTFVNTSRFFTLRIVGGGGEKKKENKLHSAHVIHKFPKSKYVQQRSFAVHNVFPHTYLITRRADGVYTRHTTTTIVVLQTTQRARTQLRPVQNFEV